MIIKTWKLSYTLDERKLTGWTNCNWSQTPERIDKEIFRWIREHFKVTNFYFEDYYPEVALRRDEDVVLFLLRWS